MPEVAEAGRPSSASSSRVRSRPRASYAKTSVVITSLSGASGLYSNSLTRPSPSTRTTPYRDASSRDAGGDHGHVAPESRWWATTSSSRAVDMVQRARWHVRIVVGNHLAVAVDRVRIPRTSSLRVTEVGCRIAVRRAVRPRSQGRPLAAASPVHAVVLWITQTSPIPLRQFDGKSISRQGRQRGGPA